MARAGGIGVMLSALLGSCGGGPTGFDRALDQAHQLSRQGKHEAARQEYVRAATLARVPDDEVEALYRAAGQLGREGRFLAAANAFRQLALTFPDSPRTQRAWLDAGRNYEKAKRPREAVTCFEHAWVDAPDSGLTRSALRRWVALGPGDTPTIARWRAALVRSDSDPIRAMIHYEIAKALSGEGEWREALEEFELSVSLDPMPEGAYADEALVAMARIRRAHGDPQGAIKALGILLESRTRSAAFGSYERSTYAQAQFLRAEILRDDLARPVEAAREFLALAQRHRDSRLVDDALWQAAWIHRVLGEPKSACRAAHKLEHERPESRYVPCLGLVCGSFGTPTPGDATRCERAKSELPSRARIRG